jgi:hypothetical protein
MAKVKNLKLKNILIEVVNGDLEAANQLINVQDNFVTELHNGKKKKYLKRTTTYNDNGIHAHYLSCLENFNKIGKDEVESLFQIALMSFVEVVIRQNNPGKVNTLSNTALVNWAKKHINGFILAEMDKQLGKVKFNNETGEIDYQEIVIVPESNSGIHDNNNSDDEDTSDLNKYDIAAYQEWEQKNLYLNFADFIKDMNLEVQLKDLLTENQRVVYYKLIEKYQVANQKTYGNSRIATELNIDEARVRKIEEIIGDKLFKLYQLWLNTKKRKSIPLSHEIRDFLTMYDRVINNVSDVNLLFEMLIGWLMTQVEKEQQVNVQHLAKNKTDQEVSIINLIADGDSQFKDVLLKMDKHLHKSSYLTICGILEGWIDKKKLRKDTKKTIINKCLDIFYTYLNNLDKELKQVANYISTYEKKEKDLHYINNGCLAEKNIKKVINI